MFPQGPPTPGHTSNSKAPASGHSIIDPDVNNNPGATNLLAAADRIMESEYFIVGAYDTSSWEMKLQLGPNVDMSDNVQAIIARMRAWSLCIQGYSPEQVVFRTTWQPDLDPHRMVMRAPDGRIEPLPLPQNLPSATLKDLQKLHLAMHDHIKAGTMEIFNFLDFGAFMRMLGHYNPATHPLNIARQDPKKQEYTIRSVPFQSTNLLRMGGQESNQPQLPLSQHRPAPLQPQPPPRADFSKHNRMPKGMKLDF